MRRGEPLLSSPLSARAFPLPAAAPLGPPTALEVREDRPTCRWSRAASSSSEKRTWGEGGQGRLCKGEGEGSGEGGRRAGRGGGQAGRQAGTADAPAGWGFKTWLCG